MLAISVTVILVILFVFTNAGLAFDSWDLDYYTSMFQRIKRNPTSVECFDLAQSNRFLLFTVNMFRPFGFSHSVTFDLSLCHA